MNELHAKQDLEILSKFTDRLVVISTDSVYDPAHKRTPQTEDGIYLTQPIFVDDLAQAMLDCVDCPDTFNQIFCVGGPEAVENRRYYEIIGEILGSPVCICEVPLTGYVEAHPEYAGHLCHRIYDLSKLKRQVFPCPLRRWKWG